MLAAERIKDASRPSGGHDASSPPDVAPGEIQLLVPAFGYVISLAWKEELLNNA